MTVIGYTQGTYDLFHKGHLNLIENAKKQCDYLIVGINSDRLVQEYKNKIPIYSESDRLSIVNGLKAVDEVVLCDTLDKMASWKKFHFHKIFIGDDWKGNPRWEKTAEELKKINVETIFLPHTDGISSTMIKQKIKEGNVIR